MTADTSPLALSVEPCWSMHSLQVANWGGFQSYGHELHFALDGASLLSGTPGSGKSSLLDAVLAVMMPGAKLRYNEASNETGGRPRDVRTGQRTTLGYVRGKTGERHTSAGMRSDVLRGDNTSTWSAVAVKFSNDRGDKFTAARLYFAPRSATSDSEVKTYGMTAPDHIDIDKVQVMVTESGFDSDQAGPLLGAQWYSTPRKFESAVQVHLGIGRGGDGSEALVLLSRIQAGKAMDDSVDGLFKEMVLNRPETFAIADHAVTEFTLTEQAYNEAVTAADKRELLSPITDLYEQYKEHSRHTTLLESLTSRIDTATPTALETWALDRERQLVDAAMDANRERADDLEAQRHIATQDKEQLSRRKDDLTIAYNNASAGIPRAEQELRAAHTALDQCTRRRDSLDQHLELLGADLVDGQDQFDAFLSTAHEFLSAAETERTRLNNERDPHVIAAGDAKKRITELTGERELLERSPGRMPKHLLQSRQAIMAATGLTAQELPFVGELLDIRPEYAQWRLGAESALAGITRLLLVDNTRLAEFSARSDDLPMAQVRYQGVDLDQPAVGQVRTGHISEVLDFADSPFSNWVRTRVCREDSDALRVNDPSDLGGSQFKVTINGQTRRGHGGAVGTADLSRLIGFSNKMRLEEIDEEISQARTIARESGELADQCEQGLRVHERKVHAYQSAIAVGDWPSVDVAAAEAAVQRCEAELRRLRSENPRLDQIKRDLDAADEAYDVAVQRLGRLKSRIVDIDTVFDDLTSRDRALHGKTSGTCSPQQSEELQSIYDQIGGGGDYTPEGFAKIVRNLTDRIRDQLRVIKLERGNAESKLTNIFNLYNERWKDDPNRGVAIDSYPQYLQILSEITNEELYRTRAAFQKLMDEQTGTHLLNLARAHTEAIEAIEERLDPIRQILAGLPFGEHRHRLDLRMERIRSAEVDEFRDRLYTLTRELSAARTEEDYLHRYEQMREVINLIRPPARGKTDPRRQRLLDVRRHIKITAAAIDNSAGQSREVKHYDMVGQLSGGEWQELVAFVAAAALRYRLGDSGGDRLRYRPVILDEAFIKANSEFALRGIKAWLDLGFQLIIAAPHDKVTGIEVAMAQSKCIVKSPEGYSFISDFRK